MLTSKYKKILGLFCLVLLAVVVDQSLLALHQTAHAISIVPGNSVTSAGSLGDTLKDVMTKVAAVNTFMHVLLLLALQFVGYFLQADFFNDPAMTSALFTIWQLSRNIMNVIFALMLIGVSFYVIITAKTDLIKEKMVQFVIAVVLVNMSWFFPRVILDVANVLTATVFDVPNLLPSASVGCQMLDENNNAVPCKVITAVLLFADMESTEASDFCSNNGGGAVGSTSCPCVPSIECHVEKDYDVALSSGGMAPAHAMINGLAVSFAKVAQLAKIPTTIAGTGPLGASQSVKVSMQIALSIMMAFLVQITMVLPLLGLAIGLLIRIVVIWVTTAFMPFAFIGYVVNGKLGTDVFGFETDIWKEFINAAFLPAVVGIPMTIGFIMLSTVAQVPEPAGMSFNMTVPILNGVKSWWAMIWMFAAIGIIWVGTFTALAKSKITGKFTEKIRAFGETVAGGVAQLPLLTPIPLPGLQNANLGTLVNGPKLLSDTIRFQASGAATGSFSENLKRRFGQGGNNNNGGANPNNAGLTPEQIAQEIDAGRQNADKIVQALERLNRASNETERRAAVVEIQREVGGTNGENALARTRDIISSSSNQQLKQIQINFDQEIQKERAANNPPNNP